MSIEKLMTETVISTSPDKKIEDIRKLMVEYAISQVPVIENDEVVGMISEKDIMKAYGKNGKNTKKLKVKEVMSSPPPTVNMNTKIESIVDFLHENPAILVYDSEKIRGIVTRADIVYWALDL